MPSTTARRPSASLSSSSSGVGSEEYKARAAQLAAEKRAKDAAKEDLRKQLERDKKERAAAQAHMAARTQVGEETHKKGIGTCGSSKDSGVWMGLAPFLGGV